jgi:hypothetical protein
VTTGSVIANSLVGNTLESTNYRETGGGINSTTGFTNKGTFFNLNTGELISKNFKIDSSGNATFKGTITATAGSFGNISLQNNILTMGGFTITSNGLSIKSLGDNDHMYFGSTGVSYSIAGVNRNDWRFVVGKTFGISASGAVAATNIKI